MVRALHNTWATGRERRRLYAVWSGMHARCADPSRADFARYGERGITVCERWSSPNRPRSRLAYALRAANPRRCRMNTSDDIRSKDNGGPAFPVECSAQAHENAHQTGHVLYQTYGMTLLDYFAGEAMKASTPFVNIGIADNELQRHVDHFYRVAAAMLKARQS